MEYNRSTTKEKWTIMMYMRDFDLMATYAYALRASNNLSSDNIDEILTQMEEDGIYRPRNGGSTFTGQFKSIQIAWYMFGYYNKSRRREDDKKMVFSPLGNLLLDNLKDKDKATKIFATMLYGNGFRQPFSRMDDRFNIYPYRLIFKLLRDPRLNGRLYNDEVFYLIMFLKTVTIEIYEELVIDILNLRSQSPFSKFKKFKDNERVLGLSCHEWRYGSGMLESAGVIRILNNNENRVIGELSYGNISKTTGKRNAVRHYTEDFIELNPEIVSLVDKLLSNYAFYQKPYPDDEVKNRFTSSMVIDMYSFYPPELLVDIGIDTQEDKAITTMLSMANNVNYFASKETEGGIKFEEALTEAFNMFVDVEAERIGGAGSSDIECVHYISSSIWKKFDIEAKSTSRKLVQINSRRLKTHRSLIGSKYTIIVTPSYSIGVLKDIENENSVIIKSATLANYLYQYISRNGRLISYEDLSGIIEKNIGGDITDHVNDLVYSNFGHTASDLSITEKKKGHSFYGSELNMVAESASQYGDSGCIED